MKYFFIGFNSKREPASQEKDGKRIIEKG